MLTRGNKPEDPMAVNGAAIPFGDSMSIAVIAVIVGLLGLIPTLCQASPEADDDATQTRIALVEAARARKDSLFRHDPDSPLPAETRSSFDGLSYFPVDVEYHLIGNLHRYGRPRIVRLPSNAGSFIEVERFGRFVFEFRGGTWMLEIVRSVNEGELSVFFSARTNGSETYSGGRYARLRPEKEGKYALDLNEAYNPYCTYNPAYICPLPPVQNNLPFEIRSGERDFETSGPDLAR